ncbi:MAG: 50S ribosomal protein L13 [Mycoplasma sp.]|nr:50S ribosomal protein L13 [Mycoplasma sp.]
MRQTTIINNQNREKKWFLINASNLVLGRLAVIIATYLRGKHKVGFTENADMGDNIVVINAKDVVLTSDKEDKKKYYFHSGYPGGLKTFSARDMRKRKPTFLLAHAVKGMLPKNKLGRQLFRNLFIYEDNNHLQQAQQPQLLDVKKMIDKE